MIQDRNVHRDANFLRKSATFPWRINMSQFDADRVMYQSQPEYNWRLTGLNTWWGNQLAGAPVRIAAMAVNYLDTVGSPLMSGETATTFQLEEFFHRRNGVGSPTPGDEIDILREFSGPITQAFTDPFTISDGFWGVFLVLTSHSGIGSSTISTVARSSLMEFPTEEIALANCPQKPDGFGRVAIGTIQAVGGDFIAGTTNTDAGLVAAFNTFDQFGFVMDIGLQNGRGYWNGGGSDTLRDPSGVMLLGGKGKPGMTFRSGPIIPAETGTILVVTLKEVGGNVSQTSPDQTGITVDYRPWPVGGEGLGDVSVSQTPSTFVP